MIGLKWLKKWCYLLILIGTGVIYLSCVDHWQVYAEPIALAKDVYAGLSGNRELPAGENGVESTPGNGQGSSGAGDAGDGHEAAEPGNTDGAQETAGAGNYGENQDVSAGEENSSDTQQGTSEDNSQDAQQGAQEENSDGGQEASEGEEAGVPPVFTSVEDDYFADAVFIGDSRTVGMFEYGGLEEISTFYASTGLTVYKLFDSAIVTVPGQKKKITVEQALQENSFRKIYLMIGINEMGTGTVETFAAKYKEVVDHLLELQPDAILYIQGIMKVTTERSNQGDYITNEGIEARNEAIAELADEERIFYLDVNPVICDETGGMVEDYTFDGVHLKAQYIELWKDFLKQHAIQ